MVWRRNAEQRAAQRYATQLPPWLATSFGASEFYTLGQIRAGVAALRLDVLHLDLAFAAYLPEASIDDSAAAFDDRAHWPPTSRSRAELILLAR